MISKKLALLLATASSAFAQGGPAVASPEISPDHHVTFRIAAPKATDVGLTIDYGSEKLSKDDKGIWSVTVGPLASGDYVYSFTVDGVAMADPVNPRIKLRARTSASLVQVPGDKPELWEARDVPHGNVDINWEKSKVINGETRSVWVYTPPGYEKETSRKYPVLYLLHGSNDTQAGWVTVGNINYILDNLIAGKKAVPMIIVMPFGHALPFGQGGGRGGPRPAAQVGAEAAAGGATPGSNTLLFESYLLKDVMPMVEAKYRTMAGPDSRAIAGMSMGGEQSLAIAFGHPELFTSIGALSPSMPRELADRWASTIADPKSTNARMKTIWIACGRQDPGHLTASRRIAETLEKSGVKYVYWETEGFHNYSLWERQMVELFPLLFAQSSASARQ